MLYGRSQMRLLVVSHPCATPINQQIYAEIEHQTDWQVTLVVPECWKDEFGNRLLAQRWESFRGTFCSVPVVPSGNIILHAYKLNWSRFLKSNRFDLIYVSNEPYAAATAQVAWANRHGIRAPFGFYSAQNIPKKYPPPFSWTERMVYRQSAFAFPITSAVAEVLKTKGFRGSASICPLPLDPALYRPRNLEERPAALESCSPGETIIGYVGRIVEEKGLATLARALGLLRDLPWKLLVIGTGPFETQFQSELQKAGINDRAITPGYVPHNVTPEYLAAMDILVLPSETQKNWKEQFGRVLLEALACGAAIIGSDSGEIPNLIRQSGGGLIFPERDADALAAALRRFIVDPQLRHSSAEIGRRWVLDNVSLQAVAKKMTATLREAVEARSNQPES
jgi:glycosyltransferase involved in cell wall biosynthesis